MSHPEASEGMIDGDQIIIIHSGIAAFAGVVFSVRALALARLRLVCPYQIGLPCLFPLGVA